MPLVETHKLNSRSNIENQRQIYNGLDCCITVEVLEELQNLPIHESQTYDFSRALQAPILDMMLRGIRVDEYERRKGIELLTKRIDRLEYMLMKMAVSMWGKPLNPRSPQQLKDFFYGAMRIPEHHIREKGKKKVSTNRETLEKLQAYFHVRPIISVILCLRDYLKQKNVLETQIDEDGRMRTSYNIGGTETGRLSSSKSATNTGGNMQNLQKDTDEVAAGDRVSIRQVFVADDDWKMCGIDLEQTESHDVGLIQGLILGDWTYLDAVESGDIHTRVATMVWPDLGWPGNKRGNREIADRTFYRNFSYRDMAKRGGHACLTKDHEVLTPDGWVSIEMKPDIIMIYDESGKSYFAPVDKWTHQWYEGDMTSFSGTSVSLTMTPNHRVPFKTHPKNPLKVKSAELGPGSFMPLGEGYTGGTVEVPARLIAAFMSDGHQKSKNRMEFHLKKKRKIVRLRELCKQYNYTMREFPERHKYIVHGSLPRRLDAYALDWTAKCIRDFIHEYRHWDGHVSKTAQSVFSSDLDHIEWLQTLGRLVGVGGNLQKPRISDWSLKPSYTLQQNRRRYAAGRSVKVSKEFRVARVFCPTVSSGFFYVRRNGKICVTGNSNYMTTPFTMSRALKIPIGVAKSFQERYYGAFPAFPKWFRWTAQEIQTKQVLTTPFGRTRQFFGRPRDDATLREAIAFVPQSTSADRMNLGLYRLWREAGLSDRIRLLAQVHDAVYFMYRPEDEAEIIPWALKRIEVVMDYGFRKMIVPGEAKIGWNLGNYDEKGNPDGLRKFNPEKPDDRTRTDAFNRVL